MNFPRRGASLQIGWKGERGVGGDSQDADLLVFDQLYAHSWGRNTAILWTSAGTQLDDDVNVVRSYFTLGGFLNLSAVTPETLVGPALRDRARHLLPAGWTRRAGIPQRAGIRWHIDRARQCVEILERCLGQLAKTNGSVFLGLDTLLGPVYFATGFDDEGGSNVYLFLGRTF